MAKKKSKGRKLRQLFIKNLKVNLLCTYLAVEFEIMMMEDEEENDIMNRLDYIKLETIYQDYKVLGGDDGLDLHTFIAVMT
jgi:hypothetical protein